MSSSERACVVVPVKSFALAKVRLSAALDGPARAALARSMATQVVGAADPLPIWCVCEDDDVADWARSLGAGVDWTPGLGLNGAVQESVRRRAGDGFGRVVVAHGDLPFAADLASLAVAEPDEAILVPDRRGSGTNVISIPSGSGFRFAYGVDSFPLHRDEARRCGLTVQVLQVDHLGWDVDEPGDLDVPAHLGRIPGT